MLLAVLAVVTTACSRGFQVRDFPTPETLYGAAMVEFNKGHWDNAVEAFDKVSLQLGSRDPLLPKANFFLGQAYLKRREFLIAANTFARVAENFPDDSLADDALLEQAAAYARLWPKPTLDQQYGLLAQTTLRTMLAGYPDSPLRQPAAKELARLEDLLAAKDYEIGMHYKRRGAYDSAIIYFRDVLKIYPSTDHARLAGLSLLGVYQQIKYGEDAKEMCTSLRQAWPQDGQVKSACPGTVTAQAPVQAPVPASAPKP
jgi:outer membrane protein assembly factor BamD